MTSEIHNTCCIAAGLRRCFAAVSRNRREEFTP